MKGDIEKMNSDAIKKLYLTNAHSSTTKSMVEFKAERGKSLHKSMIQRKQTTNWEQG